MFDQLLSKDIFLDGWKLFVEVVDLCFRPVLSSEDVKHLGLLARRFYEFYEGFFYSGDQKLHVCEYTIHLLLHLEDSIRDSGPLLNMSQFPMETFIGESIHGMNAKHLAAESLFEHWKLKESYKNYSIRSNHPTTDERFAFNPVRYHPRDALHNVTSTGAFAGMVLCHPRKDTTVASFEESFGIPGARLLADFYANRLDVSATHATGIVLGNPDITLWARMTFREQFDEDSRVVYLGVHRAMADDRSRRSYYFAAEYADSSAMDSDSEESAGEEEK